MAISSTGFCFILLIKPINKTLFQKKYIITSKCLRSMAYILDRNGATRCTLDASRGEAFTQRGFADLIAEAHTKGHDYYIARAHLTPNTENGIIYNCYDARQLCKYIFEMVISADGRKIRVKNFKDPVSQKELSEVNFFRLRYDSETPMRAEFVGNHVTFLESNSLRNKLFYQEDAMEALSINFQFKHAEKLPYIKKKGVLDFILVILMLAMLGTVSYIGIKYGKHRLVKKDMDFKKLSKKE
ncbi:hypothetical protein PAEPH01_0770 [Pancytospora epiphaga]|nr:hypothetical protein PAEPH01_0770 [Pancytospora epiphaga]